MIRIYWPESGLFDRLWRGVIVSCLAVSVIACSAGYEADAEAGLETGMPMFEPWPPWTPSDRVENLQSQYRLSGDLSLGDIGDWITGALVENGYTDNRFYEAPGGYVVVAKMEEIDEAGAPMRSDVRFLPPDYPRPMNLEEWVGQLFSAPQGRYRQMIFIVSGVPYDPPPNDYPTASEFLEVVDGGFTRLPAAYDDVAFSDDHFVDVLIYEFLKDRPDAEALMLTRGRGIPARTHLQASGLQAALAPGAG